MKYLYRTLFDEVTKWVERREILAIKGPRQSGKTTLLEMLAEWLENVKNIAKNDIIYLSFEDRELLDNFSSDPLGFVKSYLHEGAKCYFLMDEAQYCDDLGQKLKLVYDTYKGTKFIITGSSSLELTSQTGKFLVGRMFEFELMPMSFYEFLMAKDERLAGIFNSSNLKVRRLVDGSAGFKHKSRDIFIKELLKLLDEFIVFGGYPEVVKAKSIEEKTAVLKGIVNTYIEKDIVSYLHITDTIKFRRLVVLLAASNGAMMNFSELSSQIGSYFKETERLFNILQQTYVINAIRPYHRNLRTELRKNPRAYFVDTGLRNYLIDNLGDLSKRPDAGQLAENFVLNEIRRYSKVNFWRTTAKTEIDFIAAKGEPKPIEVKFSHLVKEQLTKSMYGFVGEYKPKYGMIVTKDLWGEKAIGGTKIKFVPICYI